MSKGIKTGNTCECSKELRVVRTYQSQEGLIRYFKCKCGNKYRGIGTNLRKYYSPIRQICDCSAVLKNTNTARNSKGIASYYECFSCSKRFRLYNGERTEIFERKERKSTPHVYKLKPTHPLGRIIKGYAMSGSPRDTEKLPDDGFYIDVTHLNCVSDVESNTNFDDSAIRFLITSKEFSAPKIEEDEYLEAA